MAVRVFLVEDMVVTRQLIEDACHALGGFRVVGCATTEAEARLWLEDNQRGWDLAIIDLILEQGSGIGVLAHAKRQPLAGKAIIFSSYATPGVRDRCLELGADAVFEKQDTQGFVAWLANLVDGGPAGA
jgi:two-component system OmpR family response regulator